MIPPFPDCAFPNTVQVYLCDDAGNREGGFNPAPGASATLPASVQEHGSRWDGARNVSVVEYWVRFQSDPAAHLSRPPRSGDQVAWAGLTLGVTGPALDRGGIGWLFRLKCEHIIS